MSNFLANLAARSLNRAEVVEPRLASLFEPAQALSSSPAAHGLEPEPPDAPLSDSAAELPGSPYWKSEASIGPALARPTERATHQESHEPPGGIEKLSVPNPDSYLSKFAHTDEGTRSGMESERKMRATQGGGTQPPRNQPASAEHSRAIAEGSEEIQSENDLRRGQNLSATIAHDFSQGSSQQRAAEEQGAKSVAHGFAEPLPVEAVSPVRPANAGQAAETQMSSASMRVRAKDSLPTVKITIGRIELRAVMPARPTATRKPSSPQPSPLSLDDYLKQRSGGRR